MKSVLYDVQWQRLRISCLQARSNDGGWTTKEGMLFNLHVLETYLEGAETGVERTLRKYRINNALNAVVMGYNGQGADAELIGIVREFRRNHSEGFNTYDVKRVAASWQWDPQLRQLIALRKEDKEEFEFLLANLAHRSKNGSRENRPELYKFLELMRTAART